MLEAALEFAALLLNAGAGESGEQTGNTLPAADGKLLPTEVDLQVPAGLVQATPAATDRATEAGLAQASAGTGAAANAQRAATLGDDVAAEIRRAQTESQIRQPLSGAAGLAAGGGAIAAAAQAAIAAGDAGAAARPNEAVPAVPPAQAPVAIADVVAQARADRQSMPGSRRAVDATGALRAEPLAAAFGAAPRDLAAAPNVQQALPQLAGPDVMPGDGEWGRQFAERVGWVIQARVPQAQLTLNPEHLGPIDMAIEVEDAQARVQFAAAHAQTREAIEQSLPRLREMLEQQGLELAQADVGGRDDRSGGDDGLPAQADAGASARPVDDVDAEDAAQAGGGKPLVYRARGLVDTFV